jgi:hypothetical protein
MAVPLLGQDVMYCKKCWMNKQIRCVMHQISSTDIYTTRWRCSVCGHFTSIDRDRYYHPKQDDIYEKAAKDAELLSKIQDYYDKMTAAQVIPEITCKWCHEKHKQDTQCKCGVEKCIKYYEECYRQIESYIDPFGFKRINIYGSVYQKLMKGVQDLMPRVEYKYTHNNAIIELKFHNTSMKKGAFKTDILPMVTVLKQLIPASDRNYDGNTFTWEIDPKHWATMEQIFKSSNWTIKELKDTVKADDIPVEVPKDYAESFYKNNTPVGSPKEDIQSIKVKLGVILGITIVAQSLDELKKIYRKKAIELHPDRNPANAAKMSELNYLWRVYQELKGVN